MSSGVWVARPLCALVFISVLVSSAAAFAQAVDHTQHQMPASSGQKDHAEGSGTSWEPASTPMYAIHRELGDWQVMGHGNFFLQYLFEGGDRGDDQFGSINWVMAMADRKVGGDGRLRVRGMLSLEPWTIGGCGYPDLLASGEVCEGTAIVDRQHPHDFLMEAAVQYERPLSSGLSLDLYGGLAGEPALGPTAFPHRASAMANPIAPLSHHWLDSTHITYGVLTGGVFGPKWKVEGSVFNGREPDDRRYDLDFGALDSFSARAWYLPNPNVALQVSAGHLGEAEADPHGGPRTDVGRVTASATYNRPFRDASSNWASTVAWGRNSEDDEATNFFLAETHVNYNEVDSWYGRFEIGGKSAHDLGLEDVEDVFTVSKLQAGYTHYLQTWKGLKPGVGGVLSMSLVPSRLDPVYGNRATFGFGIYVTLRPAAMAGH
jgi:hypothetical protein